MALWQALVLALYYGICSTKVLILFIGPQLYGSIIGLFVGIVMGDASKGVMIGAAIHTIYLGVVLYGGTMPSDQFLACIIAIPIAIYTGMATEAAVAMAAAFGALGVLFDTLWKTINTSVWTPMVDRACESLSFGTIQRASLWYSIGANVLIRGPIVFMILYLGADAVNWLMSNMPQWLVQGLINMGSILPAMGFAIFISIIGKPMQIPYFIVGFYVMKFFNIPIIGAAIFGFFLAFLSIVWVDPQFTKKGEGN
ncbi:PTS sugar transporter subunit IIC [Eubacteriales bacterium OttesenSCG-928-N14]|nr:PTS sugar transporter subunit IIC [Eubacteriales bacterium OttesenSCG-928-N14]